MSREKSGRKATPIKNLTINEVDFSIFLAKDFFQPSWAHPDLLSLVKKARNSYLKYGPVPLIDNYDPKSLVYLVKAEYPYLPNKKVRLTEWLCVRFTPGEGQPEVTEDFLLSAHGKLSLKQSMFTKHGADGFKQFVSMSRICRIPPTNSDKNIHLKKNSHTLASFALANEAFLNHTHKYGPFKYISGLFRPELLEKKFSATINGKQFPRYALPQKTLKLNGDDEIKINRNFYIYSYPGYFLKLSDIYTCLKSLVDKNRISQKTLGHYLGAGSLETLANLESRSKKLGYFLTVKGPLRFSKLTGNQLRKIFNNQVADGPQLKIMSRRLWHRDIKTIISKLHKII